MRQETVFNRNSSQPRAGKSISPVFQSQSAERKVAGGRLIVEPAERRDVCSIKRAFDVSIESAQIERRRSWTAASTYKMAVVFEQAKGGAVRKWECKECHQLVAESDTIAYHLVGGILYGWCENCFRARPKVVVELAA